MGLFNIDWKKDPLGLQAIESDTNKFLDTVPFLGQNRIASRNLDYQRENLAYQKALQQEIFRREDLAYYRKMQDMIGAGLSPILGAGGSGASAGQALSTEGLKESAPAEAFMQALQILNLSKMKADIGQTEAQKDVLNANVNNIEAHTRSTDVRTDQFIHDAQKYGHGFGPTIFSKGFTEFGKKIGDVKKAIETDNQQFKKKIDEMDEFDKKLLMIDPRAYHFFRSNKERKK